MDVNGDERFELGSVDARQFLRGDVDQLVEDVEEFPVGGWHHALVIARLLQRQFRLGRPYHL